MWPFSMCQFNLKEICADSHLSNHCHCTIPCKKRWTTYLTTNDTEIPELSFRFLLIFENNLQWRTERMVALPTLLAFVGRKITNRTNGMLWEVAKHADKTEKDLPRRDTPWFVNVWIFCFLFKHCVLYHFVYSNCLHNKH